jgi:CDP-glycerol glycerophosphotransferase (TagB/SpsB family)
MGDRQAARAAAVIVVTIAGACGAYLLVAALGLPGAAVAALLNSGLLYCLYGALIHGSADGAVLRRQLKRLAPLLVAATGLAGAATMAGDEARLGLAVTICAGGVGLWLRSATTPRGRGRWDRRTVQNATWRALELILAPLTILAHLMPRDERLWAFGSWNGTRFADNPRYLFAWITANQRHGVRAVWISRRAGVVRLVREQGGDAHTWLSPKGLWYALRAGVYVFDSRIGDINRVAVGRARTVNLWHGVPLKRIEADITNATHPIRRAHASRGLRRLAWRFARPEFFERYDRLVAPSSGVAECFASAFRMQTQQVVVAPYPRADGLWSQGSRADGPGSARLAGDGGMRLLYAPTFRDAGNSASQGIPVDWTHLEGLLSAHRATLLVKLHPVDRRLAPEPSAFRAIRFVPADDDVYTALSTADALVTDYSSIYFDFLLVDRPIVFYAYDLDTYTASSRSLYFPYDQMTPGPVATDYQSLAARISELLADYAGFSTRWAAERARVRALIHRYTDPPFSERTAAVLRDTLRLDAREAA